MCAMASPKRLSIDLSRLLDAVERLPARVARTVENFSKERFRAQNWLDEVAQPWQSRKVTSGRKKGDTDRDATRAILVKSGQLRRSIRARASGMQVTIGSDLPYAEIHNEGGEVNTVQSVRAYTRKNGQQVKAHGRKVNYTMPQRRFMGSSAALGKEIETQIEQQLREALRRGAEKGPTG